MKSERQLKILDLIKKQHIKNQKELIKVLQENGIHATQATVSRDIKDLKLIKVPSTNGYSYFSTSKSNPYTFTNSDLEINQKYLNKIQNIFRETVTKITANEFLIVIQTLPGMAQAAAHAIDTLNLDSLMGTIAGDDTIFVAVRDTSKINSLLNKFRSLIE